MMSMVQNARTGKLGHANVRRKISIINVEERIVLSPQMGSVSTNRYLNAVVRLPDEVGSQEKIVICLDVTMVLCEEERQVL